MRTVCLLGVAALGFSSLACSGGSEGVRSVTGALKTDSGVTQVVAKSTAQPSQSYTAAVDASGRFTLDLPMNQRYVVVFKAGDQAIGVLHFKESASGAFSTRLAVTGGLPPSSKPLDTEEDDDGAIDLGDVDDADGDALYESSNNPSEQVDSDDDGESDYADSDDDNDGESDDVDSDDDNDGVDDAAEDLDADDDGLPDDIDDAAEGA